MFEAAHEANPRSIKAYYNKGVVLCAVGRHMKAMGAFRRCILMDEMFAPAYVKLGNLALLSGKPKTAAENYLMALERDPRQVEALVNLATIEWSKGNYPVAEEFLRTAYEYNDSSFLVTYNLGIMMCKSCASNQMAVLWRRQNKNQLT